MEQLKQIIKFSSAFDKRHKDPSKDYGIHGVDLYMAVIGKKGAISFTLFTNWMLPEVQEEHQGKRSFEKLIEKPSPAGLWISRSALL